MKTAVETIFVGKDRQYDRRFLQKCAHHLADPVACTSASGWEKGQIENQVGLVRPEWFRAEAYLSQLSLAREQRNFSLFLSQGNGQFRRARVSDTCDMAEGRSLLQSSDCGPLCSPHECA